ncbi:MAG: YeeE/YedE thiosulfate transporter family protein, partial [Aestuariivirga sp.]
MNDAVNPTHIVVWGGFALAFIFGAVANKANYCTMGAISDVVNMGHWGRVRMWLSTIAVAIIGANLLNYGGLIDLPKSVYRRPTIPWLSLLVGGTLFGVGMTLAA